MQALLCQGTNSIGSWGGLAQMGSSPFLLEGVWKEGRDGEGTTEDSHFYSSASQGSAGIASARIATPSQMGE